MCGIAGIVQVDYDSVQQIKSKLDVMGQLIAHRGPDGTGLWKNTEQSVGLVHRRLSIIDLSTAGNQPMIGENGSVIVFNGEIYNYKELRENLSQIWNFHSNSDTECILAAYAKYNDACLEHLRGMFAFAVWDKKNQRLFCARDRFGIKPFYYTVVDGVFYFASEVKALLPFLPQITTNPSALAEYLTFQYTIGEKTLFEGIHQLLPGHALCIENGKINVWRYWDVSYQIDFDHSPMYFQHRLQELVDDSLSLHLRSDVPVGSYVSGGIDSSLIHILANRDSGQNSLGFHGRFTDYSGYDESAFAQAASKRANGELHCIDITSQDFHTYIEQIIYHLDFPVAGPGSFPQFMVSQLAAQHLKVVLGGQGGDEIFGGYARYLVAYFEQCIKAAIDGQYTNGNYVVTIESIVPNLGLLREYKPLIKNFWSEGLFEPMDQRYFRLIDRSTDMQEEIDWSALDHHQVFEDFAKIFNNRANVQKEAYFDKMTHFDFKCLLPALLQVEDRMSMAHGLESRVPFLDHPLVEFAATIPADIKFQGGNMKYLLKQVFASELPQEIVNRRDKMGFPVPLKEWFDRDLRDFVMDMFSTMAAKNRPYINSKALLRNFGSEAHFSRKTWGLLSLELWHQQFHDRATEWRTLLTSNQDNS
ncbi:asparagine synthase (glutamine-hydrolyzing) [Laspinema olomoucense]|uniref:asparagine synthase (glutamine-hydrolyzing) n=1 Tax=Laspinema olomoucense TaxID=3231600 RepID=UPI0021BA66F5|nr:asparagine synthase (glutamine-hydrolyzing) [Laspinema sp. D3d]MCT7974888.1 asparagine synthase (glutamine-hydrolyzing) [Laspinema sp. D3d]